MRRQTTISSWNIQGWRKKDGDPYSWDHREKLVYDELHLFPTDIVSFQEYDADKNDKVVALALPSHYAYHGNELGHGQFNPVFVSSRRFKILDKGSFYLSVDRTKTKSWDASNERGVTWILLFDRAESRHLLVINTHFDNAGYIAREREAAMLVDFVEDYTQKIPDLPIVMTADWNFGFKREDIELAPKTRPLGMILEIGFIDVLHSVHGVWPPENTFDDYQGEQYNSDRWNTWDIDRILVRNLRPVNGHIVIPSPDKQQPSDHRRIIAKVDYTMPEGQLTRR